MTEKVKMTSHVRFALRYIPLEYNVLFYGFGLYILTWYQWTILNKSVFLLLGLIIIHFIVCFIKIEALKTIIHNWIEKDN